MVAGEGTRRGPLNNALGPAVGHRSAFALVGVGASNNSMKKIQAFAPKILCTLLLLIPGNVMLGQSAPQAPPPGQSLAPDQLDGLVAPIALYPDPLLSQILVASTYPLELVQAWQWLQGGG